MSGATYLTDSGLETDLIFNHGIDLPSFASFPLLEDADGRAKLASYYREHWEIARARGVGVVFDTPTWRASPIWGEQLGYDLPRLEQVNRLGVGLLQQVRAEVSASETEFVISGNLGPRGDGYQPGHLMSVEESTDYHAWQIRVLASSDVDLVSAFTINYVEEAIGVSNAASAAGIPAVISFTVETDGHLPDGTRLAEAIDRVDRESHARPAYFMINCAHPTHVLEVLAVEGPWRDRLKGFRANASRMSHAELDESELLDIGDPAELGALFADVRTLVPGITVLGGCCGTDARHVSAIAAAAAHSMPDQPTL
jgi:S-methylmethionine-dependent homocysteine/selenocysteine methylase